MDIALSLLCERAHGTLCPALARLTPVERTIVRSERNDDRDSGPSTRETGAEEWWKSWETGKSRGRKWHCHWPCCSGVYASALSPLYFVRGHYFRLRFSQLRNFTFTLPSCACHATTPPAASIRNSHNTHSTNPTQRQRSITLLTTTSINLPLVHRMRFWTISHRAK